MLAYERITGDGARDTLNRPVIVSVSQIERVVKSMSRWLCR